MKRAIVPVFVVLIVALAWHHNAAIVAQQQSRATRARDARIATNAARIQHGIDVAAFEHAHRCAEDVARRGYDVAAADAIRDAAALALASTPNATSGQREAARRVEAAMNTRASGAYAMQKDGACR